MESDLLGADSDVRQVAPEKNKKLNSLQTALFFHFTHTICAHTRAALLGTPGQQVLGPLWPSDLCEFFISSFPPGVGSVPHRFCSTLTRERHSVAAGCRRHVSDGDLLLHQVIYWTESWWQPIEDAINSNQVISLFKEPGL